MLICNVGKVDRIVRVAIALILLYWGAFVRPGFMDGIVSAVLSMILLMSGTLGFCPVYRFFKLSTNPEHRPS